MKRLFIAIKVSPDTAFLDQLHQLTSQLSNEKIKWVEEHNIHITLKFLGETEEGKIPDIIKAAADVANDTNVFNYSLKKLGVFGSSYDPRVVWVGIEPYAEIVTIMKDLREKMEPLGFEFDRQNLVPHLTIGRIKFLQDKKGFQEVIDQHKNISSLAMKADRLILFESILKKEGPEYHALQTFLLRK